MIKEQEYPGPQEKMTKKHIAMVIQALGFGASLIIDFGKIDFTRGAVQTGPKEKSFWTTDGNKVTVMMTSGGGAIGTQSKDPDPELPDVAFPGYDGS